MRYRPVVLTLMIIASVWGTITFFTMPRREDPEFTIRTCVVSTRWPGAPTIKVEELVTDKLEETLDGIEEVDKLRSTTTNGLSTIFVDLNDDIAPAAIQNVWDKVRAKVDLVEMPDPDIKPVVNDEFGDTAVLVLGIYQVPLADEFAGRQQRKYSPRDLEIYADQIRDRLRLIEGVAKVEKYGVNDEAIYIETDLGTWSQIGLTTGALRQLVKERNIVSPGGSIDTANGRFSVKPGGEFDAFNEIKSISAGTISSSGSTNQVRLEDLGLTVNRRYRDPEEVICRFTDSSGTYDAIMLAVTMQSGGNIVNLCDRCMERLDSMIGQEQLLPDDLKVVPISNQGDGVTAKINDVINNVISAIVIVVVVVFLFVGLRTSLVMGANIPIVVLISIAVISMFGVQLEQISLASIIIALGLLVDNAVQICDQTRTNILAGDSPKNAAIKAAQTLMFPMLVGTLTTVAAFLPMLFALGGAGKEYVYSLPVTLSSTLILSWLLAMSICVIFAAAFIRAPKDPAAPSAPLPWLAAWTGRLLSRFSRGKINSNAASSDAPAENLFMRVYGKSVLWSVNAKWLTVGVSVALLYASMKLPVSTEFFPQDRRDSFFVNVMLPEMATIEQTSQTVEEVEKMIRALSPSVDAEGEPVERLRAMRCMIGQGGSRWALGVDPPSPSPSVAEIIVRLKDGWMTPKFIDDLRDAIANGIPDKGIPPITGARVVPKKLAMGPPAAPLVLRIVGDGFADIDKLRSITNKVKDLVRDQPETWDVSDSWGVDGFQISLDVDEDRASLAGVTNANVADTMNAYFSGLKLTTFREGDHQVPVFFRVNPDERKDLSGIELAYVEGQNGKLPLNSIATATPVWQPAKIKRRNLNRTIEVSSEVEAGVAGNDVVDRVLSSDRMKEIEAELPTGYRIEAGGSKEESERSAGQMLTSFGISFLMIVFILVIQYNGWSKTLVILATLPLAMMGAKFGLWVTDSPLGFMPQLGLLSLFGIVLNTGIIFIEFADILIQRKRKELLDSDNANGPIVGLTRDDFRECLVNAGKQRLLPIFLTTATTIGGLIPLALSGGPLWEGLAWLMIFGLVVATFLTLYVVPALYAIFVETLRVNPVAIEEDETVA